MTGTKADQVLEKVLGEDPLAEECTLTLSNGAVVKLTPPPSMVLQLFRQHNPKPRPPMAEASDGERTWKEPNPNDPDYLDALEKHDTDTSDALIRLMLWSSLEILELPRNVPAYEDDKDWVDEIQELLGAPVPETARLRKVAWIRYRIIPSTRDFSLVQDTLTKLSGVSEEDIAAAEETFRGESGSA